MNISSHDEYEAAALRANALSDAAEGSAAATELAELVAALRVWDEEHKGENTHGPEPVQGFVASDRAGSITGTGELS